MRPIWEQGGGERIVTKSDARWLCPPPSPGVHPWWRSRWRLACVLCVSGASPWSVGACGRFFNPKMGRRRVFLSFMSRNSYTTKSTI